MSWDMVRSVHHIVGQRPTNVIEPPQLQLQV
jgi:hypothetical protein